MSIELRHRTYFPYLDVPADVRRRLGRRVFRQTLKTDSKRLAEQLAAPVIARWRVQIVEARGPEHTNEVKAWRDALRRAQTPEDKDLVLGLIEDAADPLGLSAASAPAARRIYAEATGVPTLEHLDEWLAATSNTPKTKDMHRSDVKRFAVKFPMLHNIDRAAVRRWVTALMHESEGLSPKTMQRVLSGLRGYWRYLQTIGVVTEANEPFTKLDVARQGKGRGAMDRRQPFAPPDVVKLLAAAVAQEDAKLADLIRLAMWTGCRIDELCALRVGDVAGAKFTVSEAKTAAGMRVVPIHAELQPAVARLVNESKDGYVLSGLSFNKYGDRSNAIGKRFGRLRTTSGFGREVVFHSIRKTVITILENAGVSENVVADIVGHEKPRITYGLYSGGATLEVKRAALAKLEYPKPAYPPAEPQ